MVEKYYFKFQCLCRCSVCLWESKKTYLNSWVFQSLAAGSTFKQQVALTPVFHLQRPTHNMKKCLGWSFGGAKNPERGLSLFAV